MRFLPVTLASIFLISPASAQSFTQFIGFGDSQLDSGYFRYAPGENPAQLSRITTALANGGAITPSGGIMNSDILASYFGLTARPSNAPGGGTNYAVYAARINDQNLVGGPSPSVIQQMGNYLTASGGVANPNALYMISIGGNDLTAFANNPPPGQTFAQFIAPRLASFVTSASALSAAGAKYLVVSGNTGNSANGAVLTQGLWNGLAAAGINFIPADLRALRNTVVADPARFGFTSASTVNTACHRPNTAPGVTGFSIYCIPSTAPAGAGSSQTAYLNSVDALQTNFFVDDVHFSPAGQKIVADYVYSLIVAPSQISFLTESALQFRRSVNLGIQEQIDISRHATSEGFNVWFNGDLSSLKLNNSSAGFPSDPSTPISGTLGANYNFNGNALLGAAVTLGSLDPSFSLGGGFKEQEVATSIFGAVRNGPLWADAIMSFGWLHYDVNRIVPLGISFDSNSASTRGHNFSFAGLVGYDFQSAVVVHGPVAGIELQSVGIDSFTETGGFTALAFSDLGRNSTVSRLGYRAAFDYGRWRPFAEVTWNHEFENTANKTVRATLTSVAAPSYSMPIVQFGRDWASASVGTTVSLADHWTGLASFNAQLGQHGVTNYGGRLGINYALNSTTPVKLITK
jgi:outer membrane lipase/esterase